MVWPLLLLTEYALHGLVNVFTFTALDSISHCAFTPHSVLGSSGTPQPMSCSDGIVRTMGFNDISDLPEVGIGRKDYANTMMNFFSSGSGLPANARGLPQLSVFLYQWILMSSQVLIYTCLFVFLLLRITSALQKLVAYAVPVQGSQVRLVACRAVTLYRRIRREIIFAWFCHAMLNTVRAYYMPASSRFPVEDDVASSPTRALARELFAMDLVLTYGIHLLVLLAFSHRAMIMYVGISSLLRGAIIGATLLLSVIFELSILFPRKSPIIGLFSFMNSNDLFDDDDVYGKAAYSSGHTDDSRPDFSSEDVTALVEQLTKSTFPWLLVTFFIFAVGAFLHLWASLKLFSVHVTCLHRLQNRTTRVLATNAAPMMPPSPVQDVFSVSCISVSEDGTAAWNVTVNLPHVLSLKDMKQRIYGLIPSASVAYSHTLVLTYIHDTFGYELTLDESCDLSACAAMANYRFNAYWMPIALAPPSSTVANDRRPMQ
jgi:hypothetical protein